MTCEPVSNQTPADRPTPGASMAVSTEGTAALEMLSGQQEARAFWRMRMRIAATLVHQTFADSWFRLVLITGLSGLLWYGLYWLFWDGFIFLETAIPSADLHDQAVRHVFGVFFGALSVMLVFSSAIILYGLLFRAGDVGLLLTMPARCERVFLHKFQEAVLLSSWGFVLLGSPMMLAYGVVLGAPWYYYLMLLPLLVAFTYIPSAVGSILCLLLVRYMPGGRNLVLVGTVIGLLILAVVFSWWVNSSVQNDTLDFTWFQEMMDRLSITEHRLLPSWWLSSGLLEAGRAVWTESVLFLTLLVANALFFRQVAIWTAGGIYRSAYSRLHSERAARRRTKVAWIDQAAGRVIAGMPTGVRLLMIKDLRLFRRDPMQWSQFLIFFGLLAVYFFNIRSFHYDARSGSWVNMVSFLNFSVVGLLLSTFTTRFIFPMISLEGQRFWLLGLMPVSRDAIVWSKFLFAVCGSIVPASVLILTSDLMLRVDVMIVVFHQVACAILCSGLSGIAVGLGAKIPSLREDSPSRIAAGFGGTLTLVLSTFFIAMVILLIALPSHFYFGGRDSTFISNRPALLAWLEIWLIAGSITSVVLGVIATLAPLKIGISAFRKAEF